MSVDSKDVEDADLDEQVRRLRERDRAWCAAASDGSSVEEVVDFWTEDGLVLGPGMPPVQGRDALREYVTQSLAIPGFRISWTTDEVDMSKDGTMAWIRGTNRVEMTGEDGSPIAMDGRVVTVWRRSDDDQWRCCADIWNGG